jgi:hypothetical protein
MFPAAILCAALLPASAVTSAKKKPGTGRYTRRQAALDADTDSEDNTLKTELQGILKGNVSDPEDTVPQKGRGKKKSAVPSSKMEPMRGGPATVTMAEGSQDRLPDVCSSHLPLSQMFFIVYCTCLSLIGQMRQQQRVVNNKAWLLVPNLNI